MKGLSTSACKKKGSPSTLDNPPVPAFGVRDRPSAFRNVPCASRRLPFWRTAAISRASPIWSGPSWLACGKSADQRAIAAFLALAVRSCLVRLSARASPPISAGVRETSFSTIMRAYHIKHALARIISTHSIFYSARIDRGSLDLLNLQARLLAHCLWSQRSGHRISNATLSPAPRSPARICSAPCGGST